MRTKTAKRTSFHVYWGSGNETTIWHNLQRFTHSQLLTGIWHNCSHIIDLWQLVSNDWNVICTFADEMLRYACNWRRCSLQPAGNGSTSEPTFSVVLLCLSHYQTNNTWSYKLQLFLWTATDFKLYRIIALLGTSWGHSILQSGMVTL